MIEKNIYICFFRIKWIQTKIDKNLDYRYRKLTAACQAKANKKKNRGIMGITLTIGSKIA